MTEHAGAGECSSEPSLRPSREALKGHAAMLLFSLLVAGSFSLGAMAAGEIAPAVLNATRFAIAAAIVGSLAALRGDLKPHYFRAPWRFVVLGGLFAAYFVLMFEGLKTAAPVSAAAVFTLTPFMAALFGWWLLGQTPSRRVFGALGLGALGALWVIFRGDLNALARLAIGKGESIYLVGCAFHAVYTPMVRRLNRGEPATAFTFGTILGGLVVLLAWGWSDLWLTNWASLPPIVWIAIVYLAVFASSATFLLLQFATLRLPSSKVMAYTYLTPAWVIVWEVLLGHELPPARVALGVILTLAALGLLLRPTAGDAGHPG